MKGPIGYREEKKPGTRRQSAKGRMLVVSGRRVQPPRISLHHVRVQVDRRIGYDLKAGPDEDEGQAKDQDRQPVLLTVEPGVEHRSKLRGRSIQKITQARR